MQWAVRLDDRVALAVGLDRPQRRARLMLVASVVGLVAGFAAALDAIAADDAVGMVIALVMLGGALHLFLVRPRAPRQKR